MIFGANRHRLDRETLGCLRVIACPLPWKSCAHERVSVGRLWLAHPGPTGDEERKSRSFSRFLRYFGGFSSRSAIARSSLATAEDVAPARWSIAAKVASRCSGVSMNQEDAVGSFKVAANASRVENRSKKGRAEVSTSRRISEQTRGVSSGDGRDHSKCLRSAWSKWNGMTTVGVRSPPPVSKCSRMAWISRNRIPAVPPIRQVPSGSNRIPKRRVCPPNCVVLR